jgi:hypothetical protein
MFSNIIKFLTLHPHLPRNQQLLRLSSDALSHQNKHIKQYFTVTKQPLTSQRHRRTGVAANYLTCNMGIGMENVDEI